MGFTKLDSGIVNSSIWSESLSTRIVWITILAMSDENGFVSCSYPGLQRAANIPMSDFTESIKVLESPDKYSRTSDFDGRRIQKVEGGWIILNFMKYRERGDVIREQTRERVKRYREKNKNVTQCNVTETLPSVSVSASDSSSDSKENKKQRNIIPPALSDVEKYCKERKNNVDHKKWFNFYEAKGWMIGKNKMKDWQAAVRTWEDTIPNQQSTCYTEK